MDLVTHFLLSHSGLWVRGWAYCKSGDYRCDGQTPVCSHNLGGRCRHGSSRNSILSFLGL